MPVRGKRLSGNQVLFPLASNRQEFLGARRAARAYSSAWLERFPDKEEVDGSSPSRPTASIEAARPADWGTTMKKVLALAVLAGVGYLVYRQVAASRAEDDLWTQATAAPDLR